MHVRHTHRHTQRVKKCLNWQNKTNNTSTLKNRNNIGTQFPHNSNTVWKLYNAHWFKPLSKTCCVQKSFYFSLALPSRPFSIAWWHPLLLCQRKREYISTVTSSMCSEETWSESYWVCIFNKIPPAPSVFVAMVTTPVVKRIDSRKGSPTSPSCGPGSRALKRHKTVAIVR